MQKQNVIAKKSRENPKHFFNMGLMALPTKVGCVVCVLQCTTMNCGVSTILKNLRGCSIFKIRRLPDYCF